MEKKQFEWLGTGSAALLLGVSTQTVRRYVDSGRLPYIETDLGRICKRSDIEAIAEHRAIEQAQRLSKQASQRETLAVRKRQEKLALREARWQARMERAEAEKAAIQAELLIIFTELKERE